MIYREGFNLFVKVWILSKPQTPLPPPPQKIWTTIQNSFGIIFPNKNRIWAGTSSPSLNPYLIIIIILFISGNRVDKKFHLIKIRFGTYTDTFDEIERDRKNTLESQLAVIGGTMGLLTGFSILSAVEIAYFVAKLFMSLRKPIGY